MEEISFMVDEDIRELARQAVAEGRLLDLKSDVVFKSFFSKDSPEGVYCRTKMISAIIGKNVESATVLNPDILPDFIQGKFPRLDIHCVLDDKSEVDVEMQGTKQHDDQIKRSIYYGAVLAKNAVKTGVLYSQMPRVIQIMFMDCTVIEDEKGKERFHHSYTFRDDENGKQLSDVFQIHFIELPKLKGKLETMSELEFWAMMIKSGGSEKTQELFKKFEERQEDLKMANALLHDISTSEKEWWIKFSYESAERERNAYFTNTLEQAKQQAMREGMQQGIQQGIQQGMQQGIQQGIQQGMQQGIQQGMQKGLAQGQGVFVRKMLAKGHTFSEIADLTGYSESQIKTFVEDTL